MSEEYSSELEELHAFQEKAEIYGWEPDSKKYKAGLLLIEKKWKALNKQALSKALGKHVKGAADDADDEWNTRKYSWPGAYYEVSKTVKSKEEIISTLNKHFKGADFKVDRRAPGSAGVLRITCVVDGKDMTKRATLDGKKLMVKDSYIRGAPLSDSESEEDKEVAQDDEAVAAAEKDTSGASASAEPPTGLQARQKG